MASYANVIEGLKLLAKHTKDGEESHIGGADHDIIYAGEVDEPLTEEESKALDKMGWHFDQAVDSWARFV